MKTKTRLIITISSVVLAIIASVVAVVAVFAARNATAKSTLYITYTAVDIQGSVKLETKRELETDWYTTNVTGTGVTNGTLSFSGNEAENELKSMSLGSSTTSYDISAKGATGNAGSHYVVLKFTFTNSNTSKDYTAKLTVPTTGVNVTFEYSADGTSFGTTKSDVTVPKKTGSTDGSATYYVKIRPTNTGSTATIAGGDLSWALASKLS